MNIYAVLILQLLISSGTHIVAKAVVSDVDPVTLTFLRTVVSGLGMILLLRARSSKSQLRVVFVVCHAGDNAFHERAREINSLSP